MILSLALGDQRCSSHRLELHAGQDWTVAYFCQRLQGKVSRWGLHQEASMAIKPMLIQQLVLGSTRWAQDSGGSRKTGQGHGCSIWPMPGGMVRWRGRQILHREVSCLELVSCACQKKISFNCDHRMLRHSFRGECIVSLCQLRWNHMIGNDRHFCFWARWKNLGFGRWLRREWKTPTTRLIPILSKPSKTKFAFESYPFEAFHKQFCFRMLTLLETNLSVPQV